MKDIHVVYKKMTRNGPKTVILKSTTNFYGTDVMYLNSISAFLSIVKFKQQHFNLASPLKLNWHEFMWWPYFVVTDLTEIYMIFKDQIILAPGRWILAGFWVPHEIENCSFQNLLVFGFPETSQNLISCRQFLFSLFHGEGPRGKFQNPYQGYPLLLF